MTEEERQVYQNIPIYYVVLVRCEGWLYSRYALWDELHRIPCMLSDIDLLYERYVIPLLRRGGVQVQTQCVGRDVSSLSQTQVQGQPFWNYGPEVVGVAGVTNTYDANPQTPATWAAVSAGR